MKQIRWIIALAAAALLLTVIFFAVDSRAKKQEEKAKAGEGRTLFDIDTTLVTRITIDGPDGNYAFDWNENAANWELTSEDQFNLNFYAVAAICNYFCTLSSEKTVAFNCDNPSIYGFDDPVTLRLYTKETGTENPYVLYIGDPTPTYDAFYAMIGGSDDVFTIDQTSGSILCASKDTLKDMFLFDTYSSLVTYYKLEKDGKTEMEYTRNVGGNWELKEPTGYPLDVSAVTNLMDTVVRVTVSSFVEENPEDLAKYGLDQPWAKLWLKGLGSDAENTPMSEEIWFGANVTSREDETEMFGYFADTKQVFRILRADVHFIVTDLADYLSPYCVSIPIEDLQSVAIDMGDIYDLDSVLYLDYANKTYALDDIDVSGADTDEITKLFRAFYQSINLLEFSALEPDLNPKGDPAITITYTYKDGKQVLLEFIQIEDNNFALMIDGKYSHYTVRLNRFTGANGITKQYEALMEAINKE